MTVPHSEDAVGSRPDFPASRRILSLSRYPAKEPPSPTTHPVNHTETTMTGSQADFRKTGSTEMAQFGHDDSLAQFSFAPATETTVITTTTTTTTRFPPFVMRAPRRMNELDPKLYPLAATPTPAGLRNISFEVDGKRTMFREADDSSIAMEEIEQSQNSIQDGRPPSPDSISGQPRPFSGLPGNSGMDVMPHHSNPALSFGVRGGITSFATDEARPQRKSSRRSQGLGERRKGSRIDRSPLTPALSKFNTPTGQAPAAGNLITRDLFGAQVTPSSSESRVTADPTTSSLINTKINPERVVPTPPIQGDERHFAIPQRRQSLASIPSRLATVDVSLAQDGSLPSPSLSPITAAATLQNTGYFADIDSSSELASPHGQEIDENESSFPTHKGILARFDPTETKNGNAVSGHLPDIPAVVEFFEAVPDDLKGYIMHQLLRRCPKRTLQHVADVVNPALKCDFVTMLPAELSLLILGYLDVQSLCRASQVSKKWRHLINGDEKAWKNALAADGLSLPKGELERAIQEGWGWQDPVGIDGVERDLGRRRATKSDSEGLSQSQVANSNRRPKRKAASKFSSRNKQQKRKEMGENSANSESVDASRMISLEGPYNAANTAAMAVPYPKVGLPSLRDLHLYKSLYRRHHMIRKNWMREDANPRHIAFRAHDRHVVTCLGFDDDKIVTGSDDTNINVYDTKTGALRAKLKGHEGGVWALQYEDNVLVSGSTDRSVRVWDIEKGELKQVFHGHTSTVRCLQILMPTKIGTGYDGKAIIMPKQPLIITGSRDSNLRVWKLPSSDDPPYLPSAPPHDDMDCPYFVRTLTGHQHSVRAIAAHGDTLVSGSYDCTVRVWRISTGDLIHRLQGHAQKVYSVVLDTGRNRCISGSMDNLVKIWSLDTGSLLYTLDGHSLLVGLLDLNSERLVSAAADSTLRIWDPENGVCKATLSAHTGAITCFQHDGQKVISGSDRTLKMWNVRTGECMRDLLTDLTGVWQVKFNQRRCVAAVQRDNMTYVEVLDFGAQRDGVPPSGRGSRILVDVNGRAVDADGGPMEVDGDGDGVTEDP